MSLPPFAANLEMELDLNTDHDMALEMAILNAYAPSVHRWIDAHHVIGNAEAYAVVVRLHGRYARFAEWRELRHLEAVHPAVGAGIRLAGLIS